MTLPASEIERIEHFANANNPMQFPSTKSAFHAGYVAGAQAEAVRGREMMVAFVEWMAGRWKKNNFLADDDRWLPCGDNGFDTSKLNTTEQLLDMYIEKLNKK